MAFTDLLEQPEAVRFLQRSLERGRLAHGYLFAGARLGELEAAARTLAKTLNCAQPPRRAPNGLPLDSCDRCESCRRIDADSHPDIAWPQNTRQAPTAASNARSPKPGDGGCPAAGASSPRPATTSTTPWPPPSRGWMPTRPSRPTLPVITTRSWKACSTPVRENAWSKPSSKLAKPHTTASSSS